MKIIGLTGGIGTGKSTVSSYLKKRGCIIIDADDISRRMTNNGSPALDDIANAFGKDFILDDGSLDRKGLGNVVFNDKEKLLKLQSIITEKVVEIINLKLNTFRDENCDKIVVVDAPLLFECGMENMADENWLVSADINVRLKRVMERDHLTKDEIVSRINNQMSQTEKEKLSHVILDNSGSLDELYDQIDCQLERINNEL